MFKFLFIIFMCFNCYFSQVLFSKFINQNQIFLDNPIKSIQFDYTTQNIDGLSEQGSGRILIGQNKYKLNLQNHIFLFTGSALKRYNKITNQIFIENNNPQTDSLILNFFNIKNLDMIEVDSNGMVTIPPPNFQINDLIIELDFLSDSSAIKKINIQSNQYLISLFNLNFSNQELGLNNSFSFNFPNAFIFDLRD